ncbi:MAG: MotA/TolQ/ExbB proton channel family protein, partial [Myxococcota bacterium]|nr:MotA/TolQ/ExbB proton channel family protein [Myxococcota bacterium]
DDETAGPPARLAAVFAASAAALEQGRTLRTSSGTFFLADGTSVEGRIFQLGEVAAWGVSDQGSGSLLPIVGGRLQLRANGGGEATAQRLAAGGAEDTLDVFLLESVDKPVSERREQTFAEYMAGGGVVGWVIALLGVLGLLLAAARAGLLALAGRGVGEADRAATLVASGDMGAARARVQDGNTPTARVVRAVLGARTRGRDALQDVATEAILAEVPTLERFGAAILVIAAVAPLLGLLGTVTGMIATFDIITEYGTGDPKMLSGGISEALITTQLGLVVAIPLVLLGNTLKSRADAVEARIERAALQMVNLLDQAPGPAAASEPVPADVPSGVAERSGVPPVAHA